ncbi:hypothetical protein [Plasmodium yoelii yoelii]|uniref:Uncharacterized protein n=1 Tax=Plasmodium yoelii yoelii TaxID=73239 RepID=Q7REL2_PLAYO|nr:hypothetical protein [Plasmodium yoelii yoelii]
MCIQIVHTNCCIQIVAYKLDIFVFLFTFFFITHQHDLFSHIGIKIYFKNNRFAMIGNRRKYDLEEKMEIKNQYGNNLGLYDNAEISKLIEDMHKRSKEVMKTLQTNKAE